MGPPGSQLLRVRQSEWAIVNEAWPLASNSVSVAASRPCRMRLGTSKVVSTRQSRRFVTRVPGFSSSNKYRNDPPHRAPLAQFTSSHRSPALCSRRAHTPVVFSISIHCSSKRGKMVEEKQTTPISAPPLSDPEKDEKTKPGKHWKDNEEHVLPKNRMSLVFTGLMACTFLAALDQVHRVLLASMTAARVYKPSRSLSGIV